MTRAKTIWALLAVDVIVLMSYAEISEQRSRAQFAATIVPRSVARMQDRFDERASGMAMAQEWSDNTNTGQVAVGYQVVRYITTGWDDVAFAGDPNTHSTKGKKQ